MQSALVAVCLRPRRSPGAEACGPPSHPRSNIGGRVPDLQGLVEGKLTPVVANHKRGGGEQVPVAVLLGAVGDWRRRTKLESQKQFHLLLQPNE
jgi:hypothetical protein